MRIEVMSGLKMGGEQQNEARVGMVGRRTVGIMPEQVAKPRRGRAHIRVRVVTVDAPRLQGAIHDEVVTWAAHVVHNFFAAIFLKSFADARAESLQHLFPRRARPFPFAAPAGTLHRIEDAIRVMNLSDRRWPFRAQTSAARWMLRVAFKLRNLPGFLIDIGKKSAGRFAVKADGGNKLIMLLDATRPGFRIELDPIVPLLDRRASSEMAAVAFEIGHC